MCIADFIDIISSDIAAPFELELCGDILTIDFAVIPFEEGGEILADEAHSYQLNKLLIIC